MHRYRILRSDGTKRQRMADASGHPRYAIEPGNLYGDKASDIAAISKLAVMVIPPGPHRSVAPQGNGVSVPGRDF